MFGSLYIFTLIGLLTKIVSDLTSVAAYAVAAGLQSAVVGAAPSFSAASRP